MPQIKDVMSTDYRFISPETTLQEAAKIMKQHDLGFLPVGNNDKLVGMITDRDIAIRAVAEGKDTATCKAGDIMTPKTYYCYEDQTTEEVCKNLSEIKVRRLPVVNRDKRLVGIVSMGDLSQKAETSQIGQTEKQITEGLHSHRQAA